SPGRARNHQSNAFSTTCRSADDTSYREKQPPLRILASDCIYNGTKERVTAPGTSTMHDNSAEVSKEAEREELETVAEALGRSSRLANLLHYIGEKYFRGESSQLNEYNIATEVFARSKTTFDAGKDAIARVEVHRLRKRLQEFYEGAGRGRPIQLSIPSGTYVPVFSRRAAAVPSLKAPDLPGKPGHRTAGLTAPQAVQPTQAAHNQSAPANVGTHALSRLASPIWLYSLLAAALILSALGAYRFFRPRAASTVATIAAPRNTSATALQIAAPAPASMPLRLLAGYSGMPKTDSAGAVWEADRYVHGGGSWRCPEGPIARTSDRLLFRQWRIGDFVYEIPLRPGVYEVHLYFVVSDPSGEKPSNFSVDINGVPVLQRFDVNSDALGDNIADERVFRDVSPDKDGILHLRFASGSGTPKLNALEVLPGIPHKLLLIRLTVQSTSFTDHNGQVWHCENYYENGLALSRQQEITGSPDPDLFSAERFGHFTYAIPIDTRDRYTLVLHFAEFYFGPRLPGGGGAGSRVFRVMCNGETLLDNFDIYKEAGSLHALTKTFYRLKASAQGKLNLTFEPIANYATVSGIEVLDESQ